MISDLTITNAYKLLLDREPEDATAIADKRDLDTLDDLVLELLSSEEFMSRNRDWLRTLFSI